MRTSFLLVSAFVFAVACSKDAETTAPSSSIATVRGAAAEQADYPPGPGATATYPPGPNASAKPIPAFTTVSSVNSNTTLVDGVGLPTRDIIATCPTGAVVGGGYKFDFGAMNAAVEYSGPFGTNAWRVRVTVAGATTALVTTTAMCIS